MSGKELLDLIEKYGEARCSYGYFASGSEADEAADLSRELWQQIKSVIVPTYDYPERS